jgi:putative flippase GtrA
VFACNYYDFYLFGFLKSVSSRPSVNEWVDNVIVKKGYCPHKKQLLQETAKKREVQKKPLNIGLGKQFIRYAICGGIATAVDFIAFFLLVWFVFPALQPDDIMVRFLGISVVEVDEALRARHFLYACAGAFVVSNLCAYLLNLFFVFEGGRHKRWLEALLFYGVSLGSTGAGVALGWGLIHFVGLGTTWSALSKIACSVLVNFAGRKWIVFKS